VVGDDWLIAGTLIDLDGSPLDLTAATIDWLLFDATGAVAASFPGTAAVTIYPDVPGALAISVGRDITAEWEPGGFTDRLSVTIDGQCDLMWMGRILGHGQSLRRQAAGLASAAALAAAAEPEAVQRRHRDRRRCADDRGADAAHQHARLTERQTRWPGKQIGSAYILMRINAPASGRTY